MHGVFGAQLTIGNTSFHKLFSVSRDPYNITRGSGLRMLVDLGGGWRLLTVPSAFEMGLGDCRWIYRLAERTITVSAIVSSDEPAMQWRVAVEGDACRFLVFGHLVLGEQEFAATARWEIDARRKSFAFRPDPDSLWGQRYPNAAYRLVTSTPAQIEAVGGDELLYVDGKRRSGAYAAIRTRADQRVRLRRRRVLDRPEARGGVGGEICRGRRSGDHARLDPIAPGARSPAAFGSGTQRATPRRSTRFSRG